MELSSSCRRAVDLFSPVALMLLLLLLLILLPGRCSLRYRLLAVVLIGDFALCALHCWSSKSSFAAKTLVGVEVEVTLLVDDVGLHGHSLGVDAIVEYLAIYQIMEVPSCSH